MTDTHENLFGEKQPIEDARILRILDDLDRELPASISGEILLPKRSLNRLLDRSREMSERLSGFARMIDPATHQDIYDPSHPEAAADLVARKLIEQGRKQLSPLKAFWGSGVYALYYQGSHPAYQLISGRDIPIYVGKADPDRSNATNAREQGQRLFKRLLEHAKSINAAERYADANPELGVVPIRIGEFQCRFLVLASAYAGAVEAALIRHYQPVWNREMKVCIGFGKHGDSAETRTNTRSDWDTLHPGREWATRAGNVPNRRSPAQIQDDIIKHLEDYPDFLP
jgi:hypothetical protein